MKKRIAGILLALILMFSVNTVAYGVLIGGPSHGFSIGDTPYECLEYPEDCQGEDYGG